VDCYILVLYVLESVVTIHITYSEVTNVQDVAVAYIIVYVNNRIGTINIVVGIFIHTFIVALTL
jgi:hypothetical protein